MNIGTMFNAYPDSIGSNLGHIINFLSSDSLKDAFKSFYILPTVFNTDIDRGFSIISYDLCNLATEKDLDNLKNMGIDLTFDFILNHLSSQSFQFQDILNKGDDSKYKDFFIDWNKFWKNRGQMTDEGYIKPYDNEFDYNNLRKKGLPILMVTFPNGRKVPYWNTFYQKIVYPHLDSKDLINYTNNNDDIAERLACYINENIDKGKNPNEIDFSNFDVDKQNIINYLENNKKYLGQMDLNHKNNDVWKWYQETIQKLASYGASIIRLDSFSRLHKEPARTNFVNEPETWDILLRLKQMAKTYDVNVLPEIHSSYSKQYYKKICKLGCMTYDYFLPGLLLDALDSNDSQYLFKWANEIIIEKLNVVNMLGCHDGIPLRDIRDLLPDSRVDALIDRLIKRGGHPKIVHGIQDEVYQMDMTYYTALGCSDTKLEIARAIQLFMPGKPQIWYMDLLAEKNDENIFLKDSNIDTREVNRHSYSLKEANNLLKKPIVQKQIELLKLRNNHPAFCSDSVITIKRPSDNTLEITWKKETACVSLFVDLKSYKYEILNNI